MNFVEGFSTLDQPDHFYLESLGKCFQGVYGRGILLALDHADIIAIDPGAVGELFLRKPTFQPKSLEIARQDPPEGHGLQRSPSPSRAPPSILGICDRARDGHSPVIVVRLPRRSLDDVALQAAGITLEVQPDGALAAYAQSAGLRTLVRAGLSDLVAGALSSDPQSEAEDAQAAQKLEAELLRALEAVRARGL